MPWKDQLKQLKGEWDQFNAKHNLLPGNQSQQYPQQQYYPQQQQYTQQQQYSQPQQYNQQQQYSQPQQYAQQQQYPQQQQYTQQQHYQTQSPPSQQQQYAPQQHYQPQSPPPQQQPYAQQQHYQTQSPPPQQQPYAQQQHYPPQSPPPQQQQYAQQQHYQQQSPPPQQQQHIYNRPAPPPPYMEQQSHYQPQGQQQPQYGVPPQVPPHPSQSPQSPYSPYQQPQSPQANPIYWQPPMNPTVPIDTHWEAKLGNNNGWGNSELQHYTASPQNSFHTADGKLILRAIANTANPDPAQQFTSARLVSRLPLSRDRGVLSGVLTPPCAPGIWPAFWLLPREPFTWPTDGEIDVMETWNGDRMNHSCLHWGHYNAEDWNKHITQTTPLEQMGCGVPVRFDLAWDQPHGVPGQGRLLWYIDGRAVMKANVPNRTRPMRDFTVLLNVAMGGTVCGGQRPRDGAYDLVVHWLAMSETFEGPEGWGRFERDWVGAPEGKVG